MKKLSIIIVSFNTLDYTLKCLRSVKQQNLPISELEVIVSDNGSQDGTVKALNNEFPWVKLIRNSENLGYAAANNVALKKVKGDIILLLNSDTVLQSTSLEKMLTFLEKHEDIGVATPRLEMSDKSLDLACHRGFPTPWNAISYFTGLERIFPNIPLFSGYHLTNKDFNKPHEIEAISGACFFIRRKVIEKVGLLDERFFMYAEDIDWCMRIKKAGWKIYYNPSAVVVHYKKRSGRKKDDKQIATTDTRIIRNHTKHHFYQTMKIFYDKHYKERYPKWLRQTVIFGIWLKSRLGN